MITINGKEFRNLEEQVRKNKEDIAAHYNIDRVLADFGINVIGRLNDAAMLPDPATFVGTYGDAYAVGAQAPYRFYIFTRPDPNQGYNANYWLDIGNIAIAGPEGPRGPKGDTGATGATGPGWITFSSPTDPPSPPFTAVTNAMCLNATTGTFWKRTETNWVNMGSLRGPEGPQGPRGPAGPIGKTGPSGRPGLKGDPGQFLSIMGRIPIIGMLPSPQELNNKAACYLVGREPPYFLYVQVGNTLADRYWENIGPMNTGTLVKSNDEFVLEWDADTKVDKAVDGTQFCVYGRVYNAETAIEANPYGRGALSAVIRDEEGWIHAQVADHDALENDPTICITSSDFFRETGTMRTFRHHVYFIETYSESIGENYTDEFGNEIEEYFLYTNINTHSSIPLTADDIISREELTYSNWNGYVYTANGQIYDVVRIEQYGGSGEYYDLCCVLDNPAESGQFQPEIRRFRIHIIDPGVDDKIINY